MSIDRKRKKRHTKVMFNFKDGRDKKKEKSFDNARKKHQKEITEETRNEAIENIGSNQIKKWN